jgi:hypothetical protein
MLQNSILAHPKYSLYVHNTRRRDVTFVCREISKERKIENMSNIHFFFEISKRKWFYLTSKLFLGLFMAIFEYSEPFFSPTKLTTQRQLRIKRTTVLRIYLSWGYIRHSAWSVCGQVQSWTSPTKAVDRSSSGLVRQWTGPAVDWSGSGPVWQWTCPAVDRSRSGPAQKWPVRLWTCLAGDWSSSGPVQQWKPKSEPVWQWTGPAADRSGSRPVWLWTGPAVDWSGSGPVWQWTCPTVDLFNHVLFHPWTGLIVDWSNGGLVHLRTGIIMDWIIETGLIMEWSICGPWFDEEILNWPCMK